MNNNQNAQDLKPIPKSTARYRINTVMAKLPEKERIVVQELLKGATKQKAMETAGYAPSTARARAKDIIGKVRIQDALQTIMENSGITDQLLMNTLKEGLKAKKVHGTSDDFVEIEDHSTRHKYLETGLKLKGHLDKKVDIVHHKSHEEQLRELQGMIFEDGDIIDIEAESVG